MKAIILDWGGTCTEGSIIHDLFKKLPGKHTKEECKKVFEKNNHAYLKGKMSDEEFWRFFAKSLRIDKPPEYFIQLLKQTGKARSEIPPLLRSLRKKYALAVLSDNYQSLADWIEERYGTLFDVLVFSNRVGITKPSPSIFKMALNALGVKPSEAVFIDDREKNVAAARKIGINACVYEGGKLKKTLSQCGIGV